MYAFSKAVVLLSVALSVTAVPSHFARNAHSHQGIAARHGVATVPEAVAVVDQVVPDVSGQLTTPTRRRKRRSINGRCVPRSSSSALPASSSTPVVHTSSIKPPATTTSPHSTSTTPPHSTSHSSSAKPPQSTSSGDSNDSSLGDLLGKILSGDGTYYATGLGACGITNTDTDMIAAASEDLFDTFPGYTGGNPNNNPICNKKVSVEYNGKTIEVAITDRCVACAYGSLDFSPSAFSKLADQSIGRIHDIQWKFL